MCILQSDAYMPSLILGADNVGKISDGSECGFPWQPPPPHEPVSACSRGGGVAQGFKPPCTEDPKRREILDFLGNALSVQKI